MSLVPRSQQELEEFFDKQFATFRDLSIEDKLTTLIIRVAELQEAVYELNDKKEHHP